MDERRWSRVREVFNAVHDVEAAARTMLLDDLCGADDCLRQEVEELLGSAASADEWLAGLAARIGTGPGHDAGPDLTGQLIGNYRILGLLGRGGMGAVYLAERADAQFEKTVALKLLPLGMAAAADRQRFLAERQLLARLEHPNIARLLDGGVTEDGTPYFVLEYVKGEPITDYCDARTLTVPDRVQLFLQVCRAVEYAHQNLVVHRDLKPGNILVTDAGEVKLLDFGIARMVHEREQEHGTTTGRPGCALTPGYASPEQVRNEPVATTSDVYSLGVVLYDLLTGHPPYQLPPDHSPAQLEAIICEHVPELPSRMVQRGLEGRGRAGSTRSADADDVARARGVTVAQLSRQLAGDVDAIVLTALRKEPAQRYQSVRALADDIERSRQGLPINARRDNRAYRTTRFLARNRMLVGAGSLLLLLLLAIAGLSIRHAVISDRQARAIEEQRDLARREADRAERVTELLAGLFEATDPAEQRGDTLTAGALLGRGVTRVRADLKNEPELQGELLHVIGLAYANLGLYDAAGAVLSEAIAIRRGLGPQARAGVAASLIGLGRVNMEGWHFQVADSLYREALAIESELVAAEPGDTALALARADALAGRAVALRNLEQADSAVLLMREVVDTFDRYRGPDHARTLWARTELAYALRGADSLAEAEAIYRDVATRQRALGARADDLAATLNNLAYLLRTRGDLAAAEPIYREAHLVLEEGMGAAHPTTLLVASNLAAVLVGLHRLDEAEAILRHRIELERGHRPAGDWRIGAAWGALGTFLLRDRENAGAALSPLREQLAIYRAALGDENSWTTHARITLGECLVALRRFAEAEPLLLAGLAVSEQREGPTSSWTVRARSLLAELYQRSGRPERAARYRATGRSR